MAYERIVTPNRFIGKASETKPTMATHPGRVRIGDTLYEYDTNLFYITYDGTNWVLKIDATSGGGGGGISTTWTFGEPSLYASRNASANWVRTRPASVYQKSSTQWAANLYGGVQTNDDWASIVIPVNELPVPALDSASWTYFLTAAESAGVNIVVWIHDPDALENRAEVTQLMGKTSKDINWNVETLDTTATEMFYYGENTTGTALTAGTQYTWAQFQADVLFSTWVIYRVTIDYGWIATTTLDDAWVTDVIINDIPIPLKPDSEGSGRMGQRHFTVASGDLTGSLVPSTPYRLLSCDLHVSATPNAGELFTITKDAGQDTLYDTVIYSSDLGALALTSLYKTFEGYEMFDAADELDIFHTNSQDDDYGVTLHYQTVFA